MQNLLVKEPVKKMEYDVQGLIAQLDEFLDFSELTKYQITENFRKHGLRTYEVFNLFAEVEDINNANIVIFDDLGHALEEDLTRVLNNFCIDSIISIEQKWENNWTCSIRFKDGDILIERLGQAC